MPPRQLLLRPAPMLFGLAVGLTFLFPKTTRKRRDLFFGGWGLLIIHAFNLTPIRRRATFRVSPISKPLSLPHRRVPDLARAATLLESLRCPKRPAKKFPDLCRLPGRAASCPAAPPRTRTSPNLIRDLFTRCKIISGHSFRLSCKRNRFVCLHLRNTMPAI